MDDNSEYVCQGCQCRPGHVSIKGSSWGNRRFCYLADVWPLVQKASSVLKKLKQKWRSLLEAERNQGSETNSSCLNFFYTMTVNVGFARRRCWSSTRHQFLCSPILLASSTHTCAVDSANESIGLRHHWLEQTVVLLPHLSIWGARVNKKVLVDTKKNDIAFCFSLGLPWFFRKKQSIGLSIDF